MATVRVGENQIYYERRGGGPRLLFVNGSGTTLDEAGLIVSLFATRFDVLAYDYRGLGRSRAVTRPYDMAACAADALAVMDDAGWASARVVGLSFGGMVAQELAVTEPGRIDRPTFVEHHERFFADAKRRRREDCWASAPGSARRD